MQKRSAEGMHACAPALKSPQKESRGGQAALDCIVLALLFGGLTDALCGAYGLRADPLPLCLLAIGAAAAMRLCFLARRVGWLIGVGLCLTWVVYLFLCIDWICAGAVAFANDALSKLSDQSGGTFSFSPWQLTNGLPKTAAICEAAFLTAVLPVLGALFALLVWQKRLLLAGLLAFVWLLPALYYTILPPMIAMAAMMVAVVVLAVLHPAGGCCALPNAPVSARRGWIALPVALVCAAILLSALPPDDYSRSPKLEQARQVVESLLDSAAPGRIRNGLANTTTQVNMQRTESISFSGKTVLRVQGPSGQPLYLKGFVGGTYADSVWTAPDANVYQRFAATEAGQSGAISNPQLLPARFETLVEKQYQDGNTQKDGYSLSVKNVAANPHCAYIPYGLTALPENAAFDGDTRAEFSNFFGETAYTVPFRMYGDFLNAQYMIGGSRFSAQQRTTQWPVQLPSTSLSMLQANRLDSTSIQPLTNAILREYLWEGTNSLDRSAAQEKMNQLYLYGWQWTNITESQRKALRWLSAWTAQSLQEQKGNTLTGTEAPAYYRGLYTDALAPVKEENGQPVPDSTPLDLTEYDQETGAYWNYEFAYRKAIYDSYTAVPDALREKLMQWLQAHGLEGSAFSSLVTDRTQFVVGVAEGIKSNLAMECQYSLNPGAPPAGTDFVDYFLNTNHKGYCVHFATAETLLLRTLGIPARYAEGYYLTSDMIAEDGAWADVPDSRAHAWVEIYSPGIGWVPFEATPGFNANEAPDNTEQQNTSSAESSTASSEVASDSIASSSSQSFAAATSSTASASAATVTGSDSDDLMAMLVGIAVLTILCVLGLALRHLCAVRRRWRRFHQADRNSAGVAVYAYLLQLRAYGVHVPEEATQLGEKARFSQHTLTVEECDTLRQYAAKASAELYARQPNAWRRFVLRYLINLIYQEP